ncbi:MAG TPA: hypothetical protein VHU44_01415 [Acidobacteriaceae bacterium]|jgi:hypothetical protein|nr:hypothetical protein [Acidobacteriaceae bacterium]
MGLSILVAGCHTVQQSGNATFLERISRVGHSREAAKPGELAEKGKATIVAECEKQSYETASKGLIVSEVGLHEDVFVLRDRVSYAGVGYGLDEAQRLEDLLRAEAKVAGHPADQADCIEAFAEHLETLSDPLVEADERRKELDASAFTDAAKEAQEQADKKLREAAGSVEPKTPRAESQP